MHNLLITSLSLAAIAAANPVPQSHFSPRDILTALPESHSPLELQLQPLLDFDTDGCYNTAAIDPSGRTNPGKSATSSPQGGCRDRAQLENSNVYSRQRCNNGYCAVMYEYYFEKDQAVGGSFLGGHRHDWENIVVFSRGDEVVRVAPSCHGGYPNAGKPFQSEGGHPMLVYHKDGAGTHCFRFASGSDFGNPENHFGVFYRSALVGWDGWPSVELRDKMLRNWSGGVGPKLDDEFGDSLRTAVGGGLPGFDPYADS